MNPERDGINPTSKPTGTGCVECLTTGEWWLHLRRCAECGLDIVWKGVKLTGRYILEGEQQMLAV